ncbi:MAG: hypothetical protein Q9187_003811 [Circinaria calcarea]
MQQWEECSSQDVFVNGSDKSPPSGLSVLPSVIERTNKTIIAHGMLDYILIANGTLLMIQNMTWNGAQGFQTAPSDEFFVPYHIDYSLSTLAGAGVFGTTHTERGLTFVTVNLSGHSIGSAVCTVGCLSATGVPTGKNRQPNADGGLYNADRKFHAKVMRATDGMDSGSGEHGNWAVEDSKLFRACQEKLHIWDK